MKTRIGTSNKSILNPDSVKKLKTDHQWPLDTMVSVGQLFDGLSGNDESTDLHYDFQDLSNQNKKNEAIIRNLCMKTFERYVIKLEKAKVLDLSFLSYVHSKNSVFHLWKEFVPKFESMFNASTSKEPFSNQALESCFAYIRNLEHTRHTFQSMLSRAVITKNQSVSIWLKNHPNRQNIIREILKSRESSKRNSQQLEAESFQERLKLFRNDPNAKKSKLI